LLGLNPGFPTWTSDSRIVRFSCRRHNEQAQRLIHGIIASWKSGFST
jgi:hypothetical protein